MSISLGDRGHRSFVFDGLDASYHTLPARDLGAALTGLDAIVSTALMALETRKVQKQKPRKPSLILSVREPKAGSYDIGWLTQVAPGLLPLWPHLTQAIQSKFVEHFVNFVMLWFGGRRREADETMEKIIDILSEAMVREHEDRHREREALHAAQQRERESIRLLLQDQAQALHSAARLAITPVGRSAAIFHMGGRADDGLAHIDEPTADAIRAKEILEVSDRLDMTFRVDGVRQQKRTMFVYDPEDDEGLRMFPVTISDPAFDLPHNPYITALVEDRPITLTGKTTRLPDGRIKNFYAIDARLA